MERERARQRGEGESKSVVGRVRDKQVGGGTERGVGPIEVAVGKVLELVE